MDVEGLARGCIFEFSIDVAFLDEEGGVVELVERLSASVLLHTALRCSPSVLYAWLRRV